MTKISLNLKASGLIGGEYPAKGTLRFEPTHTQIKPGITLTEYVIPRPSTIPLDHTDGIVEFELSPTEPHWVWKIVLTVTGVNTWTEYVHIPDTENIDYALLDRADLETLNLYTDTPSPAWWSALSNALKGIKTGPRGNPGENGTPGKDGKPGAAGAAGAPGVQRDEVALIVGEHVEPLIGTTIKNFTDSYLGSNPNVVAAAVAAVDANPKILEIENNSLGPKVISFDPATGRPYWNSVSGTHRLFIRYDGKPYAALTADITETAPDNRPAINN